MLDTRLSHYHITALLGKGGMGEVYQADDLELGRRVAIKILPAEFAADPSRMARFEQEARSLAALNHPNIAGIHGIERQGDLRFLVMELADGADLSDRIARGRLPLDEALSIAQQVAAGLEEAHARGIVHRDLKPANIKVLADGTVKILDFGLAKALVTDPEAGDAQALANSPTILATLAQPGMILGTAAYMSPEQARGRPVDWRTDIWALGCVLYEMLTGQQAFGGDTLTDMLAAIIEREPDLDALPPDLPPALRDLLRRLLTKEARDRLQAAGDARIVLQECRSGRTGADAPPLASRRRPGRLLAVTLATVVLTAAATWYLAISRRTPAPAAPEPVLHLTLTLPAEYPLHHVGGSPLGLEYTAFDVSDDGSRLIYLTRSTDFDGMVAYDLETGDFHTLAGTSNAYLPQLSPDGQWIAFLADGHLKRVPYAGGVVDVLAPAPDAYDLTWGHDGMLYWIERQGVAARKMAPTLNAPVETVLEPCNCRAITDGIARDELLLSRNGEIFRLLPDGSELPLDIRSGDVTELDDGDMLFTYGGRLMGRRRNDAHGGPAPEARTVLTGLRTTTSGGGQYALSRNGTLLYVAGQYAGVAYLVRRDSAGHVQRLPFVPDAFGAMDVLPDGSRILILVDDGTDRVRVLDVPTGTVQYVDVGPRLSGLIWSADGSSLCVATRNDSTCKVIEHAIDSAAAPTVLLSSSHRVYPGGWSRDGRYLVLTEIDGSRSWLSVWDRQENKLTALTSPMLGIVWAAAFSPDERFVAYTLVGASGSEVYVVPFPTADRRWLISAGGGEEAQWRADRDEIVFRRGQGWYSVAYETEGGFSFSAPHLMFTGPYLNVSGLEFRVLADGSLILLESADPQQTTDHLDVVVNWDRELAALLSRP